RTAAGCFRASRLGASRIAATAQITDHFFIESLLQGPFHRRDNPGMDLAIHLLRDIARQGRAVHNLHVVGKVASVMKLRCMAHRDILLGIRAWLSWFYRMSRVDAISRNPPYTTLRKLPLAIMCCLCHTCGQISTT